MLELRIEDILIQFDRGGSRYFNKNGTYNWIGMPVLILSGPYLFNFDLEGRIQRIDGLPSPHSWDWLQRSMFNDWTYYDRIWVPEQIPMPSAVVGDSAWAINGRADLPMFQNHGGLQRGDVRDAFDAFDALIDRLRELTRRKPEVSGAEGVPAAPSEAARLWDFLGKAARHDRAQLRQVADRLHEIHGPMLVLPPDSIRVDYRVLCVKLMDGCTNHCAFCSVRGDAAYALRTETDIDRQIDALAGVYGADLYNYNSVVFGECDALASPSVEYAARRAYDTFHCGDSYHEGSNLFLFSTNETFLGKSGHAIENLEALPFQKIYINIGWEAVTETALSQLGKCQTAAEVLNAMERAGEINRNSEKLNISGNFITADTLEIESVAEALRETRFTGQLYLSPLQEHCAGAKALQDLLGLQKIHHDIHAHLYTMQRA